MFRIIILCLLSLNAFAEDKKIITSIRPLQSIVANLTEGTEEVGLIIDRNESLHNYQLKPTKIRSIHNSSIIIIIDRDFEVFMDKVLDNLGPEYKVIEVANIPGVALILNKDHNHQHDIHCLHQGSEYDYHIWLDIDNVKTIAKNLTNILIKEYPANEAIYKKNLNQFNLKLTALDKRINAKLSDALNKDFMVTHNAYNYFIKHYNLNTPTTITTDHDHNIGARSFLDLQKSIEKNKIQCIFEEPQFNSQTIAKLQSESKVKIGKLDAEWGPDNVPAKDIYFSIMDELSDSFSRCLK